MPLSRLAIYTTAHGIDSVDDHLDQLETSDFSPEFVALELPDVEDVTEDIDSFKRKLARQSPATGLVWYIVERINKQEYENTEGTADRGDAEFQAGRQYADQHNILDVAVDLDRGEVANQYVTWPRRLRDAVVLLIGIAVTVAVWVVALLLAFGGLQNLVEYGLTSKGILAAVLGVGVAVILGHAGRLPTLYAIGKIGYWFRDAIRDLRDEAMYERLKEIAAERSATDGLLIVGAGHFSGISVLAEQDGVDCWQIESPAISRYDGDLDGISPQEMSELAAAQDEA